MTLRAKLLAAQAPLALAVVALGVVASVAIARLAGRTDLVLKDNYRSVLAAQRMKDALARLDSGATWLVLGRAAEGMTDDRRGFEAELAAEEQNLTEPGEADAARRLRAAWTDYEDGLAAFATAPSGERYFATLAPRFRAVKDAAGAILDINQDAMVRKSADAMRSARQATTLIVATAIAACLAGVLASLALTARLLRPLSILGQAARRIGGGDLVARALVQGRDELAQLARDFNVMADRLAEYRRSSLGELLVAQQAAQSAIDSLPEPVVVLGRDGALLAANTAAAALGVAVEGAGLDGAEPEVRAAIAQARAGVAPADVGPGDFVPRATAMRDGSGLTIVLQRRAAELADTIATVAHEFRTPLTSLRMALHMLLEGAAGPLGEKQADLLYVGREDCERLQVLVDEFLDRARRPAPLPVTADELVREAALAFQAAAQRGGLELRSEIMPGLPAVRVDRERVQLVFANLLANAIRHTAAGAIVVRALPGDGAVRFEVADTGAGIAPEHQAHIFERSARVPGAPGGAAGLGLHIAKEIVEAHGGVIGLSSATGAGATFWFTLPES